MASPNDAVIGYAACVVASVFFGSNYVVVYGIDGHHSSAFFAACMSAGIAAVGALTAVARHYMSSFEIQDEAADTVRESLIEHMAQVHVMVSDATDEFFERFRRRTYVTPRSYLGFIGLYRSVYKVKVGHVEELASSINAGLSKLEQAGTDVENMKVELREKEKTLVVAQ